MLNIFNDFSISSMMAATLLHFRLMHRVTGLLKYFPIIILTMGTYGCVPMTKKDHQTPSEDPFLKSHQQDAARFESGISIHKPVADGFCSACHSDPRDTSKLALETKQLCLSCHPNRQDDLNKSTVHYPFGIGDCLTCHQAHHSENPALLNEPVATLCTMCHSIDNKEIKKSHFNITEISADCTLCHSPHGSNNAKLIRENSQHPPFEARACDTCHDKTPSSGKNKLIDPISQTCFSCHSDKEELMNKPTLHPPFASGDCAMCHFPHVSKYRALLKNTPPNFCRECHSDIPNQDHPVINHQTFIKDLDNPRESGKPFDCVSCHNPHASDHPRLKFSTSASFCLECHQK